MHTLVISGCERRRVRDHQRRQAAVPERGVIAQPRRRQQRPVAGHRHALHRQAVDSLQPGRHGFQQPARRLVAHHADEIAHVGIQPLEVRRQSLAAGPVVRVAEHFQRDHALHGAGDRTAVVTAADQAVLLLVVGGQLQARRGPCLPPPIAGRSTRPTPAGPPRRGVVVGARRARQAVVVGADDDQRQTSVRRSRDREEVHSPRSERGVGDFLHGEAGLPQMLLRCRPAACRWASPPGGRGVAARVSTCVRRFCSRSAGFAASHHLVLGPSRGNRCPRRDEQKSGSVWDSSAGFPSIHKTLDFPAFSAYHLSAACSTRRKSGYRSSYTRRGESLGRTRSGCSICSSSSRSARRCSRPRR